MVITQSLWGWIVAPLKLKVVAATAGGLGLKTPGPQPVYVTFCGLATDICPGEIGKVSVNDARVTAVKRLGLLIVKVSVEVPPEVIVLGPKDLAMVALAGLST